MYISLIVNIRSSLTHLHGLQVLVCCHSSWKSLFWCEATINLLNLKYKFRQASNHCKRGLKAAKLAYANKAKESINSQTLGSWDFWQIANSVLNKFESAVPLLFNNLEGFSSASDKTKMFTENFSKNSNLEDSSISLPAFHFSLLELI